MGILALGVVLLGPGLPVVLVILGNGITQGLMGVTNNLTWVRFFGRRHLGAVSGFVAAHTAKRVPPIVGMVVFYLPRRRMSPRGR